jgi:hypothetical protein
MGFFSVPRLPGWSFQQRIHGGVLPPPHCPDKSGPAGSPTDTLRRDSTLAPVTSKKPIVFLGMMKIAGLFKGLIFLKRVDTSSVPSEAQVLSPGLEDLRAGSGGGGCRSLQKSLPSLFGVKKMVRLCRALMAIAMLSASDVRGDR